jgi:hypothetical protein
MAQEPHVRMCVLRMHPRAGNGLCKLSVCRRCSGGGRGMLSVIRGGWVGVDDYSVLAVRCMPTSVPRWCVCMCMCMCVCMCSVCMCVYLCQCVCVCVCKGPGWADAEQIRSSHRRILYAVYSICPCRAESCKQATGLEQKAEKLGRGLQRVRDWDHGCCQSCVVRLWPSDARAIFNDSARWTGQLDSCSSAALRCFGESAEHPPPWHTTIVGGGGKLLNLHVASNTVCRIWPLS